MNDQAGKLASALADRYRLGQMLGAGGMATVYLAQDLKHDRKVAIKVLRAELAAVIGADRFLAEIKTTANLQHPHILPLHDSGEADSFLYYVMPYVQGESLRDRLNREKQLPIADAVRIGSEVAAALDYAHRHGVIHRDIKPENILLHDGSALVADFGIALAASKASSTRMTETGMSLGTPHYMSPEQAMGEREIGPQSDVYALAAVTYEMLVGEPPFSGPTAQSIVAKVLTEVPRPLLPKRHTIPPHVEAAVLTGLEKLPADRFASAAEFAEGLNGRLPSTSRFTATQARLTGTPGASRQRLVGAFVLGAVLASLALGLWIAFRPAPTTSPLRLSVGLPKDQTIQSIDAGTRLALSPDGSRLAYVGPGEGSGKIWIRRMDQLQALPVPGTEGGRSPFFSPDGEQLGFFSGTRLQVLALNGGPPTVLTDTSLTAAGGSWSRDGYVYFDANIGIGRINLKTHARELVYRIDSTAKELGVAWPEILPDNKTLIFRLRHDLTPANWDIVAMRLPDGKPQVVVRGMYARYSSAGDLLYVAADGTLFAAPFDPGKLALAGSGIAIATGVSNGAFGSADLAIAGNGSLVYTAGQSLQTLTGRAPVWVDRQGNASLVDSTWVPANIITSIALAPNGKSLAFSMTRPAGIGSDVWIKRLDTGTLSRLTFDQVWNGRPVWLPDGRSVSYISGPTSETIGDIRMKRADGSAAEELLVAGPLSDAAFSRDSRWLLLRSPSTGPNAQNIGITRFGVPDSVRWVLNSSFGEVTPAVSPDGRWLAYASNETGSFEVYVRPFPDVSSARWQVSSGGGSAPIWSHSGRELFFVAGAGMEAVDVRPGLQFSFSVQKTLFPMDRFNLDQAHWFYGVAPNDQRFLLYGALVAQEGAELIFVQNWKQSLGKH